MRNEREVLDQFLAELQRMVVNKAPTGEAKKKPLLLLLVLSRLRRGELRENKIQFLDIEPRLARLITEFGGRQTKSGSKPEQPFFHLRTSSFWELHVPSGLPSGNHKTLPKRVLAEPGSYASLRPSLFSVLLHSPSACDEAVDFLLKRWWKPEDERLLREDLGLRAAVRSS